MRLLVWVWNGARIVHASLGLKRETFVLVVLLLPIVFHERARSYAAAHGINDWPVVQGIMPAMLLAGGYLYWRLLRYAVVFEHIARPELAAHILDPSLRYDTYVALGNRVLRLYHLEVENTSMLRTARNVAVILMDYQKAGDAKVLDIRERLKVANSEAEVLDLNPGARVAFELCGVDVTGAEPASTEVRDNQTFSILPLGSGTIRVAVQAQDAPTREDQYRVYIDTTGAMTIRPQAETPLRANPSPVRGVK